MKLTLKKTLGALVIASMASTQAYAATANGSTTATVDVATALTITGTQELDLGTVIQGDTATVNAPAVCTSAAPASVGILNIANTTASQGGTLTVTAPGTLVKGVDNMAFTMTGAVFCATTAAGVVDVSAASTAITMDTDVADNNHIYIGGAVTAAAGQVVGTYSGTINVEIIY